MDWTGKTVLIVGGAGGMGLATAEMTEAQWDRTIDTNLKGTFFSCRFAIPELEKTGGQIVNIASDAGLMGNAGAAICPYDDETPMLDFQAEKFGGGGPQGYLEKRKSIYPQGAQQRFAKPAEIAAFIFTMRHQNWRQ